MPTFCGAIALSGQTSVWLDRIEAGAMAEVGDQSGQDTRDQSGREEGEPGLSGLHICCIATGYGPRNPSACGTVEEGTATERDN